MNIFKNAKKKPKAPTPTKDVNEDGLPTSSMLSDFDNLAQGLQKTDTGISVEDALLRDNFEIREKETNLHWFHENTTRNLAEWKLKEAGNSTGMYLVRDNVGNPGDFVLSLIYENKAYHYQIRQQGNGLFIEECRVAKGVDQLIVGYQLDGGGLLTRLLTACVGPAPPAYSRASGHTNLLHTAVTQGGTELALQILSSKHCPDVNAKDSQGSTVLHEACRLGLDVVVKRLLDKGVSVVQLDQHGYTPLQQACMFNQSEVLRHLIIQGRADPQDRHLHSGSVALHEAASRGHVHCVQVLLSLNAPSWPRDNNRLAPYDLATNNGHHETAQIIAHHKQHPAHTTRLDWFHGSEDRQGAIALLQKHGLKDGLFLIRRSSQHKGLYVLTMTYDLHPYNYEIHCKNNAAYFIDEGPLLPSLEHLVEYYCIRSDGLHCKLTLAITQGGMSKAMVVQWIPEKMDSNINHARPPLPGTRSPAVRHRTVHCAPSPKPPPVKEPLKLDPNSIEIGYELGQGEYGSVLKGVWTSPEGSEVDIAIKTLHQQHVDTGLELFMREAEVMVKLDHQCIVQLIGVCQGPPVMLVQELMPLGSLLDYLLDYPERVSVETDLYLWAAQVAWGMCYLEQQGFVHRDLAARNILLASKIQARVGDFGLSRAVEGTSNYYRASEGGRWPVKWYAPECVNYGTFSSASDVWSYGITLWEMFSFGAQPYGPMTGVQVIAFIEKGSRLKQPELCPDHVYSIMQRCWLYKHTKRPTFQQLFDHFRQDPTYAVSERVITGMAATGTSSSSSQANTPV